MTRTFTACIIKPRGSFHCGQSEGMREGSEDFIHSDTLFSALCHSYLLLKGRAELEQFLAAERGTNPPLVISSAFPFWRDQCYFPLPRSYQVADKETKRIRFVPKQDFEALLAGRPVKELGERGIPRPDACPWQTEDVPKVSLSRFANRPLDEGGFYHVGLTQYASDAALFFLARFAAEDWRKRLVPAIRLMCDEGIGGYRSIGKGCFDQPQFQDITLQTPPNPNAQLLLSLYSPAETEATGLSEGWYDLVTRRGYVFSPAKRSLRRKQVMMFAEGSVFPGNGRKGQLVNVTPVNASALGLDHEVWRNGLCFAVPCCLFAGGGR